jgi:hypothetical protein
MGFDQQGEIEFRVRRGENGNWDVCEKGFSKPLASFESEAEARKYAEAIASHKEGSTVVVDGD